MCRSAFIDPWTSALLPSEHVDIQYHSLSDPMLCSQIHVTYPLTKCNIIFYSVAQDSLLSEKKKKIIQVWIDMMANCIFNTSIYPRMYTRAPDSSQVDDGKAGGAPEVWQVRWLRQHYRQLESTAQLTSSPSDRRRITHNIIIRHSSRLI